MAQNPHRHQCRARCRGRGSGLGAGGWRKPGNCTHGRCHGETNLAQQEPRRAASVQNSPSTPLAPRVRDKTLPAHPFPPRVRDKTLPARPKWLNLALFLNAGRVLYRFHHQEAEQGEFCTERKAEMGLATTAHQAPPVWRTSEGPEGTGGFEATRKVAHQRPGPTGMEDVGEPGGPGCGARGRWWSPAAVPTNNSNIQPKQISHAIPPRHGLTHAQKPQNINDQISIVEILLGELHAKLPRSSQDSVPCHDQAQLVWRAPEGLEGLAAVPVGGGRAWPGFETARRAEGSRRGRLAGGPPPTGTPSSPAQRAPRPSEQPGPASSPAQRAARPHTPTGGAQRRS